MSMIDRRTAIARMALPLLVGLSFQLTPESRAAQPPGTQEADGQALIQLKVQRDQVIKQIDDILLDKAAKDPVYALARKLEGSSEDFDGDASNRAGKWVLDRANVDPTAAGKFYRLNDLVTLRTFLQIQSEPHGPLFIQGSLSPKSNFDIKMLAQRIVQEFPGENHTDISTHAKFLKFVTDGLSQYKTVIDDAIKGYYKQNSWPQDIVQALVETQAGVVRRQVYVLYDEHNRPAEYDTLRKKVQELSTEIETQSKLK